MTSLSKMNARERRFLLAATLALGLFAADVFIRRPLVHVWDGLAEEVVLRQARMRRGRRLLARAGAIKTDYAALARAAAPRNGAEGTIALVKEMESLARRHGVKIKDLRPQAAGPREKAPTALALMTESGWDPLVRFLHDLQRSPSLLRVDKAALQAKRDDGVISAQLLVRPASLDDAPGKSPDRAVN